MASFDRDVVDLQQFKNAGPAILVIAAVVAVFIGLFASLKIVPTGHVGVLRLYGTEVIMDDFLTEGFTFRNPFKSSLSMSIQDQTLTESASLLSADGLQIQLDTSLVYRLNAESAPIVLKEIGLNYEAKRIVIAMRGAVRDIGAKYSSDALYTGESRTRVREEIQARLSKELGDLGFEVRQLVLRGVKLPASLMQSIEAKQQADQEAQRMKFVLQREKLEADRKRLEAAGIRDFQRIVAQGLSRPYLTWKGIEATAKLAESNNAKVVVIGSGKDGLPLILGGAN